MKPGLCSCGELLIYEEGSPSTGIDNIVTFVSMYYCPKCGRQYIYRVSVEEVKGGAE